MSLSDYNLLYVNVQFMGGCCEVKELFGLGNMFINSIQSPVSFVIFMVIIGIFIYYLKSCYLKIKNTREVLSSVNERLSCFDAMNASDNYENIRGLFLEQSVLKYNWLGYQKTLFFMEAEYKKVVYSTVDSDEYFNADNIVGFVNLSFWNNLGSIFTGIGILGTFAGLSIGLSSIDLQNISNKEIAALVSGMNTAFFTSLVGILAAIIFNFLHKNLMENLNATIKKLNDNLEGFFISKNTEQLLAMNYEQNIEQSRQFKSFSDSLAVSIGDALEEKLSTSDFADNIKNMDITMSEMSNFMTQELSGVIGNAIYKQVNEHMLPVFINLQESIDRLSTSGQSAIADGIKNGASEELTAFASTLQEMSSNLQNVMENMQKTSGSVNDDLSTAINRVIDRMEKQGESLQSVGNQVAEDLKNTVTTLVAEIGKQQSGMMGTSAQINDELKNSLATMIESIQVSIISIAEETKKQQEHMQNSADDISHNMSCKLAEMLTGFENQITAIEKQTQIQNNALSDNSNKVTANLANSVEKISSDLNDKLAEMLAGFENQIIAIEKQTQIQNNALSDNSNKVTANLADSVEKISGDLNDKLSIMLSGFDKQIDMIRKETQIQNNALSDASNRVTSSFTNSMDAVKDDIKKIMDEYAAKNKIENEETIKFIHQLKSGLMEQQNILSQITTQVDELITKAANTADKFEQAAAPINNAGRELGEHMKEVLLATNNYNNTVKESVNTLHDSARMNIDGIQRISQEIVNAKETLAQASVQYSGVNAELNNILENLNKNLSSYNKSINEQYVESLQEYSEKLSIAYNQLSTLIDDLQDTIDDINK